MGLLALFTVIPACSKELINSNIVPNLNAFLELMKRNEGKIREAAAMILMRICERFPEAIIENQVICENFFGMAHFTFQNDLQKIKLQICMAISLLFRSAEASNR